LTEQSAMRCGPEHGDPDDIADIVPTEVKIGVLKTIIAELESLKRQRRDNED
jgi:hypothetical protein